jgi:hypothetical protein
MSQTGFAHGLTNKLNYLLINLSFGADVKSALNFWRRVLGHACAAILLHNALRKLCSKKCVVKKLKKFPETP